MRRVPSIFKQMERVMRPIFAGKISISPLGYRYGTDGFTNAQGVHLSACKDDRGDDIELYRRRTVWCPIVRDDAPTVRGQSIVVLTECKACEHRLPKGCCAIKKANAREAQP